MVNLQRKIHLQTFLGLSTVKARRLKVNTLHLINTKCGRHSYPATSSHVICFVVGSIMTVILLVAGANLLIEKKCYSAHFSKKRQSLYYLFALAGKSVFGYVITCYL